MREKLAIARKLRISRKNFSNNLEYRKLCSKCYHVYVVECIIKGKNHFKISFKGKYIPNLQIRIYDWYKYVLNNIYRFYLINFTPNDDKTLEKYQLIHLGVSKPIHFKIAEKPNEHILESFLNENGLKIVDEHLYSMLTVYDIAKI